MAKKGQRFGARDGTIKMNEIQKALNFISNLCKFTLTICILIFVGAFCWAGLTCGSFLVGLVFVGIAVIGGFWIIGKIWGWDVEETPTNNFTGDDALGCISGQVIADNITRGINK